MHIDKKYHLSYCTNVHPGEDWAETFNHLSNYLPTVKAAMAPDGNFGVGLRLSNQASAELSHDTRLQEFKDWLDAHGLYVFTMNGFPYGNFHHKRVKDQVHAPDWTTQERVDYTARLFEQLAFLLPEGISGGISTSPVSYKHWFSSREKKDIVFRNGALNMLQIAKQLHQLEAKTKKYLHLDIEPEPDGLLENSDEVVQFFETYLIPLGIDFLGKELKCSPEDAKQIIKRHLTVCYDVCHFSLAYEQPSETLKKFARQGIRVGKIQVSSALKIILDGVSDSEKLNVLKHFDEPVYLHQVTTADENGVKTYADLPDLFAAESIAGEFRAHFHVPIFVEDFDGLQSTQDQILGLLQYSELSKTCEHIEVETYTWDVLPKGLKTELSQSIIRELQWLLKRL